MKDKLTSEDFEGFFGLVAELSNLPTGGINIDWERLTIIEQRLAALEATVKKHGDMYDWWTAKPE